MHPHTPTSHNYTPHSHSYSGSALRPVPDHSAYGDAYGSDTGEGPVPYELSFLSTYGAGSAGAGAGAGPSAYAASAPATTPRRALHRRHHAAATTPSQQHLPTTREKDAGVRSTLRGVFCEREGNALAAAYVEEHRELRKCREDAEVRAARGAVGGGGGGGGSGGARGTFESRLHWKTNPAVPAVKF
eukprot:Rhum_TRINITY_DN12874_c1_g1::Rhum_TRINITY_DN12874_c1_g1_i1::g.55044::m.55044